MDEDGLAAVVLLQARLLVATILFGEQTGGLIGIGNRRGQGLVHVASPPAAHKVERVEYVDDGARVDILYQLDDVLAFICGDQ